MEFVTDEIGATTKFVSVEFAFQAMSDPHHLAGGSWRNNGKHQDKLDN